MSIASAYSTVTQRNAQDVEQIVEEQAKQAAEAAQQSDLKSSSKIEWLNHPVTAEMMRSLADEEKQLITDAIFAAVQKGLVQEIVHSLVRVHQIRKIRKEYGNAGTRP